MNKTIAAFAFAALTAIPGLAMAGPGRMADAQCRAKHQEHRAQLDTNKDGKVDRAERRAMHKESRQDRMARFDADRDGKLSDAERGRAMDARFARMDANGDGRITKVEAECTRLARHFEKIDGNADGRITKVELAAARATMRKDGKPNWRKRHSSGG
jgi:Ca2+-binding EF-hand superfamily protein